MVSRVYVSRSRSGIGSAASASRSITSIRTRIVEARRGGLAKRLNVIANRAFLDEGNLQPL